MISFSQAIQENDLETLEKFRTEESYDVLTAAIREGRPEIMAWLLQQSQINIEVKGEGKTALLFACRSDFTQGVRLLLQARANTYIKYDNNKDTTISVFATIVKGYEAYHKVEIRTLLLENEAAPALFLQEQKRNMPADLVLARRRALETYQEVLTEKVFIKPLVSIILDYALDYP